MNIEEFKQYQKNFEYLQKLLDDENNEIVLLPVKTTDTGDERVAICTKTKKGKNVFPHAILVWENPQELLIPMLLDGIDAEGNDIKRE